MGEMSLPCWFKLYGRVANKVFCDGKKRADQGPLEAFGQVGYT